MKPEDAWISAIAEWIEEYRDKGWNVYFVNFMFERLGGSRKAVLAQMSTEIERCYARLLTRTVRCPNAKKNFWRRPIWIVVPDYPVPKGIKSSLRSVALNDGLHMNGFVFLPPLTRLKINNLALEMKANEHIYVKKPLSRIDVSLVQEMPYKVASYAMKSLPRRRATTDDILVFPYEKRESIHKKSANHY